MSVISAKNAPGDRVSLYLTCLILAIVAASFFSRIWDPDFFWHLATGRWIVQNMALPDRDPFSPFSYGTDREALILKGYWLAQAGYQFISTLGGTFGLALLKSAAFVAIFGMVFHYHQSRKTPYHWVLLALLPLYETLLHFRADRPNMFSLLFFAGLLYLLETRRWKLLPLLMVVWANIHGGYLLGDVVILLYIGVLAVNQRQEVSPLVAGWALLAIGASFVTPLGITPLLVMFKFEGSAYQQATFEFMSPLRIALEYHDYYRGYLLSLLLAAAALFLWRKSSLRAPLLLLLFTAYISLQHARYMPFLVITCAFYLPLIYSRVTLPAIWGRVLLAGATTLIVILFVLDLVDGRGLTFGIEPGRFPEKAAEFVAQSGGGGQVYSHDKWGGYLLWKLPEATVLIDTRALSEEVYLQNLGILTAAQNWEEQLLALNAAIIVISAFDPLTGRSNNLWQTLGYSPNWQLTYADDSALVFFRNDVDYKGPRMNQQEKQTRGLDHALAQIRSFVAKYPQTPRHWGDLGNIHALRREIPEAVKAYRQAQNLDPDNEIYRARLKMVESR